MSRLMSSSQPSETFSSCRTSFPEPSFVCWFGMAGLETPFCPCIIDVYKINVAQTSP